ncbi:hypothetical protein LCL95_03490 [Bacillus timonensis]|nr:hypothetical protein [Bacillus timonensis]
MNTVFTFLSITLNLIALLLIIILFLKFSRLREIEKKQTNIVNEIENLFTSYVLEMKEENERLVSIVNEMNKETIKTKKDRQIHHDKDMEVKNDNQETYQMKKIDIVETNSSDDFRSMLPKYDREQDKEVPITNSKPIHTSSKINISQKDDLYMQSLSAQIQLLQKQGDTIEEIAKKLKKGKTEIELLMKFRRM